MNILDWILLVSFLFLAATLLCLRRRRRQKRSKAKCTIWFGSHTGTAVRFAHLMKDAINENLQSYYHCNVRGLEEWGVETMNARGPKNSDSNVHLFIVATSGEGAPTDNAEEFARALFAAEDKDSINVLLDGAFAAFGLGDRTYGDDHYNRWAIQLDQQLSINHQRLLPVRLGDASCLGGTSLSLEDSFHAWKEEILRKLAELSGIGDFKAKDSHSWNLIVKSNVPPPTSFQITAELARRSQVAGKTKSDHFLSLATLLSRSEHQSVDGCRLGMAHLRIIANKPMKYLQSGDHLIIWPQNNDLSIVHSDTLPMDIPIQISRESPAASSKLLPFPMTPRQILTEWLEIPNLSVAALTSSGMIEMIQKFSPMKGRFYSIGQIQQGENGNVTVTIYYRISGLCSTWLSQISMQSNLAIQIRKSAFRLPPKLRTNHSLVLIAFGTGIAPFLNCLADSSKSVHLFYGCHNMDHLALISPYIHCKITMALSRPTDGSLASRVQDRLRDWREALLDLINAKNAQVYICGPSAAVRDTLDSLKMEILGENLFDQMIQAERLHYEKWN